MSDHQTEHKETSSWMDFLLLNPLSKAMEKISNGVRKGIHVVFGNEQEKSIVAEKIMSMGMDIRRKIFNCVKPLFPEEEKSAEMDQTLAYHARKIYEKLYGVLPSRKKTEEKKPVVKKSKDGTEETVEEKETAEKGGLKKILELMATANRLTDDQIATETGAISTWMIRYTMEKQTSIPETEMDRNGQIAESVVWHLSQNLKTPLTLNKRLCQLAARRSELLLDRPELNRDTELTPPTYIDVPFVIPKDDETYESESYKRRLKEAIKNRKRKRAIAMASLHFDFEKENYPPRDPKGVYDMIKKKLPLTGRDYNSVGIGMVRKGSKMEVTIFLMEDPDQAFKEIPQPQFAAYGDDYWDRQIALNAEYDKYTERGHASRIYELLNSPTPETAPFNQKGMRITIYSYCRLWEKIQKIIGERKPGTYQGQIENINTIVPAPEKIIGERSQQTLRIELGITGNKKLIYKLIGGTDIVQRIIEKEGTVEKTFFTMDECLEELDKFEKEGFISKTGIPFLSYAA